MLCYLLLEVWLLTRRSTDPDHSWLGGGCRTGSPGRLVSLRWCHQTPEGRGPWLRWSNPSPAGKRRWIQTPWKTVSESETRSEDVRRVNRRVNKRVNKRVLTLQTSGSAVWGCTDPACPGAVPQLWPPGTGLLYRWGLSESGWWPAGQTQSWSEFKWL